MPKLRLDRDTAQVVIDHYTVYVARKSISMHIVEKDIDGNVLRGQDVGEVKINANNVDINIPSAKLLEYFNTKVNLPNNVVVLMEPEPVQPAALKTVANPGEELVSG